MKYDPTTRTLTLDRKDCYCGDGLQNGRKDCPKCKGTGNGPRGGKGKCRACYGSGWTVDPDNQIPCVRCGGDWQAHDEENWCDTVDSAIVQGIPHYVVRSNHRQTFVEAYIGLGLYSCTDYGRAWESTALGAADDEGDALIAKVIAEHSYVQATKVTRGERDDASRVLCDAIVIQVHPNGYNVVPFYGDMSVLTG